MSTDNAVMSTAAAREELDGFAGQLIGPDDDEYAEAHTVYNAFIHKRPALIARAANAADVVAVIGSTDVVMGDCDR